MWCGSNYSYVLKCRFNGCPPCMELGSILRLSHVQLFFPNSNMYVLILPVVEIGFNPTFYSVDEDATFIVFELENRNPEMEREVAVQFSTIDGTAKGMLV